MTKKKASSLRQLVSTSNGGVSRTDTYSVAPELIQVQDGFNTRGTGCDNYFERPEVIEHIENLTNAYLNGQFVPPIIVSTIDGIPFVRDGHCRLRAIHNALARGAEIKRVPVIEFRGSDADQKLLILTSNDGLKLNALDRAAVYGKLVAWGWTVSEIATKAGKSLPHIRKMLELNEYPSALKAAIANDVVSYSLAMELVDQHGFEGALEQINAAAAKNEKKTGANHAQVTKKNVTKKASYTRATRAAMDTNLKAVLNKIDTAKPVDGGYAIIVDDELLESLKALSSKLLEESTDTEKAS